jgi:hypothetical protein
MTWHKKDLAVVFYFADFDRALFSGRMRGPPNPRQAVTRPGYLEKKSVERWQEH